MRFRFAFPALASLLFAAAMLGGCASRSQAVCDADPMASWAWELPSPPPPPMAWVAAGPFRHGERTPENVTAIVIHTTEGRYDDALSFAENQERNFAGVIGYFKSNDRNVSSHYVMGRHGEICQMVNEGDIAHAQTYYNGRAFGIECAGWSRHEETWTPELLDSLVDLCAYLCVKWEIPAYHPEGTAYEGPYSVVVDEENKRFVAHGLVGHYQVQPWNKSDPGEHFPWEEFSERVRARIREYGVEPIELPSPEASQAREVFATARIKEKPVRAGEPFTYALTVRGEGVETLATEDIIFPDFSVIKDLAVAGPPSRTESSPNLVVYEITLSRPEAGAFSIGASRVKFKGAWYDTQTVRVKVE